MPPWHLDPDVGIQRFKNDISLSMEQIATIARWVDAGAPRGDLADLPAPLELPDPSQWQLAAHFGRPPDLIVKSAPYTMRANSMDSWWSPEAPWDGVDGPRWVQASEFKPAHPGGVKVVHHGHTQLNQVRDDGSKVTKVIGRHGVGKAYDLYPEGTGILLEPGGTVGWNLHYAAWVEDVVDDVVEVGLWLYPEGEVPEFETMGEQRFTAGLPEHDMPWAGDIAIAPHSIKIQQGVHVLDRAALISSYRAHMHMRGREQSLEVIYPDGRKELIAKTDNYDHIWQISYQFADDVTPIVPKGSTLVLTTTWDNTAHNPRNPDPDQWVVFGQRGVDEMSHAWLGMTYLSDEQYETMISEREMLLGATDDR